MIVSEPIGYVRNRFVESLNPEQIKQEISRIEVLPAYAAGLNGIEEHGYIDIVFMFHREQQMELETRIRSGEVRGVFATRSPRRPNHIGVTTVKLLRREGNVLLVQGADALDGSPLVDIKCCDTSLFGQYSVHQSVQAAYPRADIVRNILEGNSNFLLLQAARFHGHICPGLALGVMSGMAVMQRMLESDQEGGEYLLMVEMQNCSVDGVSFVTGCTAGKKNLLFGDFTKNSFTIQNQRGKGWEVIFIPSLQEYMARHLPMQLSVVERGFKTLALDQKRLFRLRKR